MNAEIKLIVITGAPGSGKTTLARSLCRAPCFRRWPSLTTRPPRPGEVNGEDYWFVDDATFDRALREGRLLEHVVGPQGAKYGLPMLPERLEPGVTWVAIVDEDALDGVQIALGEIGLMVVVQLLAAKDEIARRMRGRGDAECDVQARLAWARRLE